MLEDESYLSFNFRHYSYLARGLYADQLGRWLAFFVRNQILALKSEDYYRDPASVLGRLLEFVGVPPRPPAESPRPSLHSHPPMDPGLRRALLEFFAPHNRRLARLLGFDMHWEV